MGGSCQRRASHRRFCRVRVNMQMLSFAMCRCRFAVRHPLRATWLMMACLPWRSALELAASSDTGDDAALGRLQAMGQALQVAALTSVPFSW